MTRQNISAFPDRTVSGDHLFRFALITDTHLRLPADGHLTPWKAKPRESSGHGRRWSKSRISNPISLST